MTRVMKIDRLEDTTLWKHLAESEQGLARNLVAVCAEAADRMKAAPAYFAQYTLHDERHLLRTTELMARVLGPQISELSVVELPLLILAAFFHDQGMVPSSAQYSTLQSNPDFQLYRDRWLVEHPNYGDVKTQLGASFLSEAERMGLARKLDELDCAVVTDFLRYSHGAESARFVDEDYGNDKRLEVQGVILSPFVARLCGSHVLPVESLAPQHGFCFDEQIGTETVNMPYLGVVLRLADILDFDRDRAPESLLRSIHFTSDVSYSAWETHRCIEGWTISPKLIRFTMRSKHPVYEAAAHEYMDRIDEELSACHELCRSQPADFARYRLDLPAHVDRTRIGPLNNAYRYHELEFRLSRDEVVRLLMTDKLYGHPHLCVRELLQNSLDALRYRKALFASAGTEWNAGRVQLRHFVDKTGHEVVECHDNGSGMDEEIITNHFVKVGRSFYRSPEFGRERARLRASGNDFDPCSKFGIGFMSCFMLGDHIVVKTRRDYGPGREWGRPLVVEINGLGGLLVVRDGEQDQAIGTTVSIVSRRKPSFLDPWADQVWLVTVLKGYALATEFPITGDCQVPELSGSVTIPPQAEQIPTLIERAGIASMISLEQDLSEAHKELGGTVRESFLADEKALPCVENQDAKWIGATVGGRKEWCLQLTAEERPLDHYLMGESVPVCVDGILVAGTPGRPSYREDREGHLGWRNSNIHCRAAALLDARGDLKPELAPGRTPPDLFGSRLPPGWQRLKDTFDQGLGLLWKQLVGYLGKGLNPREFWRLVSVHQIRIPSIPHQAIWGLVPVSLVDADGQSCWRKVRDLGELSFCPVENGGVTLRDAEGKTVGPDQQLAAWEEQGDSEQRLRWQMNSTVLLMSGLDVRDGKVILRPTPPSNPDLALLQYEISSMFDAVHMHLVDYTGTAGHSIAVETPFPTANRNHPLVRVGHDGRYVQERSDLQQFARAFTYLIAETVSSKPKTRSLDEPEYWHKRVAHLYFTVQWDRYDSSLKAPYRVWTSGKRWLSIEESDLARWRDCPAHFS